MKYQTSESGRKGLPHTVDAVHIGSKEMDNISTQNQIFRLQIRYLRVSVISLGRYLSPSVVCVLIYRSGSMVSVVLRLPFSIAYLYWYWDVYDNERE